jgi:DNA invertase Pin-like site-specific DNA recombinase
MRGLNGKPSLEFGRNEPPPRGKSSRGPSQKKRADRPKVSIREALVVLRNIERGAGTIVALRRAAHVSRATVYRLLADCERELGVRFECERGIYSVRDWGLLSRRRVLR